MALLLQVLRFGSDEFGSRVVAVDPKMAELSRVPGTVTLDQDGTAKPVLDAMHDFESTIRRRQAALNEASVQSGSAVKWWQLGMHPSILFLDEFVALRTLFPVRADRDDPTHTVKRFDDSLRRIVTMGASAGCFVILSIAQANADQIPTMLRDAFSTRILFRPTVDEARLLWESSMVAALPHRVYGPGDAWFSSTDGQHDSVTFVHFPRFDSHFGEYRALSDLLSAYQAHDPDHNKPARKDTCES